MDVELLCPSLWRVLVAHGIDAVVPEAIEEKIAVLRWADPPRLPLPVTAHARHMK